MKDLKTMIQDALNIAASHKATLFNEWMDNNFEGRSTITEALQSDINKLNQHVKDLREAYNKLAA